MKNKKNKNRAFLKWAGGKYSLIEDIQRHLPSGNKLIEPFVGAGSVFLNTDYKQYLLNDINPDLIGLYKILQHSPEAYIEDASKLFIAANNDADIYYALREEFNQQTDNWSRAVLFLYLNRHGYNGLCRYNLSGKFNVPFGRYKKPYFPTQELEFFAEKAKARKNNVIYCDPPYAPISKTASFTQYSGNGFTVNDQIQLASLAESTINKKGVTVVISNHDTPDTREYYKQALLTELQVSRTISQKGHTRKKVSELIALYNLS
jgi:DNA adenine methylase